MTLGAEEVAGKDRLFILQSYSVCRWIDYSEAASGTVSYTHLARGEAREDSDIDTVLVLDRLEASDLAALREALAPLPERGKLCGFVSGRAELLAWEPGELFQFYHDTRPVLGSLDFLLPLLNREAALSSVRTGAGAVYHGCAHYLLHGGAPEELEALQKAAFFTLRALCWLDTGIFPASRAALPEAGRALLAAGPEELFAWAGETLKNVF